LPLRSVRPTITSSWLSDRPLGGMNALTQWAAVSTQPGAISDPPQNRWRTSLPGLSRSTMAVVNG
jgi:hypothetical protein